MGALKAVAGVRQRWGSRWINVLTYHRIAARERAGSLDQDTVEALPDQFASQLAWLKKHTDPIALEDLFGFLEGNPLPPRPVLVTFDDGYKDNFDTAFPLLRDLGMRATFFIAPKYTEERRLFWWDRVNYIVKGTRKPKTTIEYPARIEVPLVDNPWRGTRTALRIIKHSRGLDIERFLEELARAAEVDLSREDERRLADEHLMTWDDIRTLRRAGMGIGSHTYSHRVLDTLTDSELRDELTRSRSMLEAALGEPVRSIAYPVNLHLAGRPDVRQAVRDAGYRLGFARGNRMNARDRFDPLDIGRISPELSHSEAEFGAMVTFSGFAA